MLTDVTDLLGEAWDYQKSLKELLDDEACYVYTINQLHAAYKSTHEQEKRKSLKTSIHNVKNNLYECRKEISKRLCYDMNYYVPDKDE